MKLSASGGTVRLDLEAADPAIGRRCGDCQLCCRLVPVGELHKAAGERCVHQRVGKGCAIYARRPFDCAAWSCRWLASPDETAGMRRPDRAHYVIDAMTDVVRMTHSVTGDVTEAAALQVWIDPAHPEAARDPQLRTYMARMAEEHGLLTLLRFNNRIGTVVFPPAICADRQWHEFTQPTNPAIGRYASLPAEIKPPL
jgi:hypothetical protein